MPTPDTSRDIDIVIYWNEWAPTLALFLLALVFLYAVLQFVAAGSGGRAARLLNGGSLRAGLGIGLVLAGTVPAAALGLVLSERSASQRHEPSRIAVPGCSLVTWHCVRWACRVVKRRVRGIRRGFERLPELPNATPAGIAAGYGHLRLQCAITHATG